VGPLTIEKADAHVGYLEVVLTPLGFLRTQLFFKVRTGKIGAKDILHNEYLKNFTGSRPCFNGRLQKHRIYILKKHPESCSC
jgi:hypothetical protein